MNTAKKNRIFHKYGRTCLRCGSKNDITIDHIKPLSLGGTNDEKNLQPLCGKCNKWKANREIDYRTIEIEFQVKTEKFEIEEFAEIAKHMRRK